LLAELGFTIGILEFRISSLSQNLLKVKFKTSPSVNKTWRHTDFESFHPAPLTYLDNCLHRRGLVVEKQTPAFYCYLVKSQ